MKTMLRSCESAAPGAPTFLQRFAEEGAPETGAENEAAAGQAPEPAPPAEEKEAPATAAPEAPAPEPREAGTAEAPREGALLLQSVAAALQAQSRRAQAERIAEEWRRSAAEVKEIYPDFDLLKEARENAEFARLLQAGVSVRRAYEAANLEAILGEAMRFAALTGGKKTAAHIAAGGARVQENSVLDRAPALRRRDVESLTDRDILKILDEVSRGAKITF